jgi:hypothetical protein
MKKEQMSNGKIVYIFSNLVSVDDVREFETQPITANKVGGVVRVTAELQDSYVKPRPDWQVEKINKLFEEREMEFIVAWDNPDWDGAEMFIKKRFEEGCTVWVNHGEYPGCSGQILTYNAGTEQWPHGFDFRPGYKSPKEIVSWLYRHMFRSCFDA